MPAADRSAGQAEAAGQGALHHDHLSQECHEKPGFCEPSKDNLHQRETIPTTRREAAPRRDGLAGTL